MVEQIIEYINENKIPAAIGGFVFIIILMFLSCGGEESKDKDIQNVKKDIRANIKRETVENFEPLTPEEIEFKKYMFASPGKISLPVNKTEAYGNSGMPAKLSLVTDALAARDFEKATELILEFEKSMDERGKSYLVYFKAQIFYLLKKYSLARVFFKEFIRKYPNHEFSVNAREAMRFINANKL